MNNKIKLLIIIVLILVVLFSFILGYFIGKSNINGLTGNVIVDNDSYSLTKAICKENKCIDVLISCEGDKVVKMEPISDLKEFDEDWVFTGDYNYCSR